jgi:F0F1-type ATP synthase membrane subunit b/b'
MVKLPDLSLFVALALFWATYWILRQTVFKPLGSILAERETASAGAAEALDRALDSRKETLAEIDRRLTEARREAMAASDAARTAANARRAEILEAARQRARLKAAEAQKTLDAEVTRAREQLRKDAHAMASEIASRALGRKIA